VRYLSLLGLVSLICPGATFGEAQCQPAPTPIVGTWLLESIVDTVTSDWVAYWMGPQPVGAIIYTASGDVSVQFMRDPRPLLPTGATTAIHLTRLAGTDPFQRLGPAEIRDVLRGYYAFRPLSGLYGRRLDHPHR
jgi:hypothetical protein